MFPNRRTFMLAGATTVLALTGGNAFAWNTTDVSGALPSLQFTMTRAADGKTVTAADYRGKIVLLYFGYTSCPDVCPTTLLNATTMLKSLGGRADNVRVLFVTVDPNRDTLKAMKDYTGSFAPQVVGLRGTPDQLAALAKRYRVAYSVKPVGDSFEVTHGTAVYVFDRTGAIKLLFTDLETPGAKLAPMTADLNGMIDGGNKLSLWRRIRNWL
ncbi:MAG TPA: SCO family protein [Pseudolabrys sp.]|nr:SCO family protein [Pseudolabrys sp.]